MCASVHYCLKNERGQYGSHIKPQKTEPRLCRHARLVCEEIEI